MEELALLAVCLFVLLTGVGAGAWWLFHRPPCEYARRVRDAIGDAQDAVRETLERPGTARFRNVRFHGTSRVAYGEVNTTNQAGAYTGFRAFTVSPQGDVSIEGGTAAEGARPMRMLHLRDS